MSSKEKQFPYKSILIVCSVNTARSPMAVGFIKKFLSDQNISNVDINSGGIGSNARDGMLIGLDTKMVMEEVGIQLPDDSMSIDLKRHRDLISNADLIITLTDQHKEEIKRMNESYGKEIYTMREFAGDCGDIPDPSMKDLDGFRKVREMVKECLDIGLKKMINL